MSVLKVLKYPHPVLREQCEPVTAWDSSLQRLIDDMTETMYHSFGAVGLAASQVGETIRLIILDTSSRTTREDYKVLINPTIVEASRNKVMREGCLSFPEYLANIKRATKLTFTAFDRDGALKTYTVRGLEAIAVQHEIDHLDGVLMIDRINSLKTDWIRRQPKGESAGEFTNNTPSGNVSNEEEAGETAPVQAPLIQTVSLTTESKPYDHFS
ncbi:MAG: peptide deformylase [Vampirovibrio sp.]|jgi:peptide deformylase|nr:peptide deformylase [Vampirovibrio sp.]